MLMFRPVRLPVGLLFLPFLWSTCTTPAKAQDCPLDGPNQGYLNGPPTPVPTRPASPNPATLVTRVVQLVRAPRTRRASWSRAKAVT